MVRVGMLQSFRGTVDEFGIRTIRLERDEEHGRPLDEGVAEFWFVADRRDVRRIRAAFFAGERQTALSMICEKSVSLGSIVPPR